MLTLLFLSVLTLAFRVEPTMAIGTIYIKANGSVTPVGAPITTADNTTYTLTGDIIYPAYTGIIVQRNNIIINGNGHTLQGNGTETGLNLTTVNNVTIKNTKIDNFLYGIKLDHSSGSSIVGNNITNNGYGILLSSSSGNSANQNMIINNVYGIQLNSSSSNTVSGNKITSNNSGYGISLELSSSNNSVSGNNIANTSHGIWLNSSSNDNSLSGNKITSNNIGYSIEIRYSSGTSISGNNIANNLFGIYIFSSSNNRASGNNITLNTYYGIQLYSSSNNRVSGNNLAHNAYGIELYFSSANNTINGNNVTSNNNYGIFFDQSSNNTFYHNNFINNPTQVSTDQSINAWDNGYPSSGNYWSTYHNLDLKNGIQQNETGSDGIGDTAYTINANNTDHYPLMAPLTTFYAGTWNGVPFNVDVVSNSTASAFHFNPTEGAFIRFNVTGSSGTGFSRVTISKQLLWAQPPTNWVVMIGGGPVTPTISEDANYTYLYFTYTQSTKTVTITGTNTVPEFPPTTILPLLAVLTLLAIILLKKRTRRDPKT